MPKGNPNPKRENLKPFVKGPDPRRNKKGPPKGVMISTILKKLMNAKASKDVLDLPFIKKLSKSKTLTNGEVMALRLLTNAVVGGDVKAMKEILDRLEGKAQQSVKHSGDVNVIKIVRE